MDEYTSNFNQNKSDSVELAWLAVEKVPQKWATFFSHEFYLKLSLWHSMSLSYSPLDHAKFKGLLITSGAPIVKFWADTAVLITVWS